MAKRVAWCRSFFAVGVTSFLGVLLRCVTVLGMRLISRRGWLGSTRTEWNCGEQDFHCLRAE
jgi:hypothetical protein